MTVLARGQSRPARGSPPALSAARTSRAPAGHCAVRGRCGAATARPASCPCPGRGTGRQSAPAAAPAARADRQAPSSGARRCRPPDGAPAAAARPTAGRPRAAARAGRRSRAAPRTCATGSLPSGRAPAPATRVRPPAHPPRRRRPSRASAPAFRARRGNRRSAPRSAPARRMRTGSSAKAGGHMAQHALLQVALRRHSGSISVPSSRSAIALMVRSRRCRSCSSVTDGSACTVKPW